MPYDVYVNQSTLLLMQTIDKFIDECCERKTDSVVNIATFYDAFEKWCIDRELWPFTKKHVGIALSKMGYVKHKKSNITLYLGISMPETIRG